MLRITQKGDDATGLTLGIEGRLTGPWVSLLEQECIRHRANRPLVWLDCSSVTFADARGIEGLRRLLRIGVRLVNCPALIRELLSVDGLLPGADPNGEVYR